MSRSVCYDRPRLPCGPFALTVRFGAAYNDARPGPESRVCLCVGRGSDERTKQESHLEAPVCPSVLISRRNAAGSGATAS